MYNKNECAKVNVKVLIILILVTAAIGISLFTARQARRSLLSKMDLDAGRAAFEEQDWPTASRKLRGFLGRNPDDIEILKKYAKATLSIRPLNIEAVSGAIGAYRRIIQLDTLDQIAYEKLAMLYAGVGNFEELAYTARTRINHVPDDRKAPLWLAEALFRLHKTNEAEQVLSDFLAELDALDEKYPQYVQARALMSTIILSDNRINARIKALEMLNKAVEYSPESAEALVSRARFYREEPEISSMSRQLARKDLEAADALDTENPRIHLSLGLEWLAHGQTERAAAKLKLIESLPEETLEEHFFDIDDWTVTKYLFASQLATQNKAIAEGVFLSDQALTELQEKGHRSRVLPTAIRFYVAAGRVVEARQYLDEYIDIMHTQEAKSAESTFMLAYLKAQVAKAEEKPYAVIDALQPFVVSDASRPELWLLLAEAYSRTGQSRRKADALVQYLRYYPQDSEMTLHLAKEYLRLGDWKKAFDTARLAESLNSTDINPRLVRIEAGINLARGQLQSIDTARLEALSVELAELQRNNPDRVDIRILQTAITAYLQQPEKVERELKLAIEACDESLPAEMQLVSYYSRTNRRSEAIDICQKACERYSQVSEPWIALSGLHMANSDYDSARDCLRQGLNAVVERPEKRSLSIALALLELTNGDRTVGINLLRELAAEDKNDVRARSLLLTIRGIREDQAEAEKLIGELQQAEGETGLQWRFHQASLWLSSSAWHSKQQDIINYLQYCIDSDSGWSAPVLLLADIYEKLGDSRRVEEICRSALARNPSAVQIADRLMTLLEKQRRFSEIEQLIQRTQANSRFVSAWQVRSALGTGDVSRAIDELKLRISQGDQDASSRIQLARLIHQHTGDIDQALMYIQQAEAITPDSIVLTGIKATILRNEGQTQEAHRILDDYVTDHEDFNAYWLRASHLAIGGEIERAEKDFLKLTTFPKQGAAGYILLGNFYAYYNKLDQAIAVLEEGLEVYPADLGLKRKLMQLLLRRNNTQDQEKALEILTALEERLPQDSELLTTRALQLISKATSESLKTARDKLENAVKLNPTAVNAHLLLIGIAMQEGQYASALDLAIRALGSNPNNIELLSARARAELALGNTQRAVELTRIILRQDPNNSEAMNIAVQSKDRSLLDEVRVLIESTIRKSPMDEKLLLSRAHVLVALERPQMAIPELDAYIQTKEGGVSVPAMVTLADLYRLNNDLDQARERIKQAELIEPNNQLVVHAKLLLWIAMNRLDEIENISSAYLSAKEQNPSTLLAAASILASMDSAALKQEALKLFEQAVSLSPSMLSARLGLASVLYQIGDTQRAKQAYQDVLKEYPNSIQALNDLAWILQEHEKRYDDALELANRGLRVSRDEKDRLHLLDTRGTILSNMPDRLADARTDFMMLVDASRNDTRQKAKALLKLGRICVKLDDLTQARQHVQNAMEIDNKINVLTPDERAEIKRILQEGGIQALNSK